MKSILTTLRGAGLGFAIALVLACIIVACEWFARPSSDWGLKDSLVLGALVISLTYWAGALFLIGVALIWSMCELTAKTFSLLGILAPLLYTITAYTPPIHEYLVDLPWAIPPSAVGVLSAFLTSAGLSLWRKRVSV